MKKINRTTPTPGNKSDGVQPVASAEEIAAAVREWGDLRARINAFNALPDQVLRAVASGRVRWPVMAGRDKGALHATSETLDAVDLASGLPENTSKRLGQRKIPDLGILTNDWALCYMRWMQEAWRQKAASDHISNLPPLTKSTARKWAGLAWKEFLKMCPNPENDPEFLAFGKNRADKYEPSSRTQRSSEKTRVQNIRDGIREAFVTAFIRLVRD